MIRYGKLVVKQRNNTPLNNNNSSKSFYDEDTSFNPNIYGFTVFEEDGDSGAVDTGLLWEDGTPIIFYTESEKIKLGFDLSGNKEHEEE